MIYVLFCFVFLGKYINLLSPKIAQGVVKDKIMFYEFYVCQ